MTWYRIVLHYACGGIATRYNKIFKTAPIFNWMIGKDIKFIRRWINKKNGSIEKL